MQNPDCLGQMLEVDCQECWACLEEPVRKKQIEIN
jgi:hypothetical protein